MLKNMIVWGIVGILNGKGYDVFIGKKRNKNEDFTFRVLLYLSVTMFLISLISSFVTPNWYSFLAYVIGFIIQGILAIIFKD